VVVDPLATTANRTKNTQQTYALLPVAIHSNKQNTIKMNIRKKA
jgi:hypothetical protein